MTRTRRTSRRRTEARALAILLVAGVLVLPGCGSDSEDETAASTSPTPTASAAEDASQAASNVRQATVAIEAYFAENQTYVGATTESLRELDAGLENVTVVSTEPGTYCVESTVGAATFHKAGPADHVAEGGCP
jgi:hypothetical protein